MSVIEFDGGYGRTGTITAAVAVCCGCTAKKLCLVMDQSQGEYEAGTICSECLAVSFPAIASQGDAVETAKRLAGYIQDVERRPSLTYVRLSPDEARELLAAVTAKDAK